MLVGFTLSCLVLFLMQLPLGKRPEESSPCTDLCYGLCIASWPYVCVASTESK